MSSFNTESTYHPEEAEEKVVVSGATTPYDGRSVWTGRDRSNTESTLVSSVTEDTRSISTAPGPVVPANTPASGSVIGAPVDAENVLERMETVTMGTGGQAKGIVQGSNVGSMGDLKDVENEREGVKESTLWKGEALWMAESGLRRLVQLAKDENESDSSKSVEEYYSQHLAAAIKEVGVRFDAALLK